HPLGTLRSALEELEVIDHHAELAPLGPALLRGLGPGVQFQMPFDVHLVALAETLQHEIRLPAILAAIPDLHIDEARNLFPLLTVLVELAVVHREAELGTGPGSARLNRLRVTGQSTDQHHLVEIRHGAHSYTVVRVPVEHSHTIQPFGWTGQA